MTTTKTLVLTSLMATPMVAMAVAYRPSVAMVALGLLTFAPLVSHLLSPSRGPA